MEYGYPEIKKSGYEMAYILCTKRDPIDPLYTIRRIIVSSGTWSTEGMMKSINFLLKQNSTAKSFSILIFCPNKINTTNY
jgi:hypothetical protein